MERHSDALAGSTQPAEPTDRPSVSDAQSNPGKPSDGQPEDAGPSGTAEALAHTNNAPSAADSGSSNLAHDMDKLDVQDSGEEASMPGNSNGSKGHSEAGKDTAQEGTSDLSTHKASDEDASEPSGKAIDYGALEPNSQASGSDNPEPSSKAREDASTEPSSKAVEDGTSEPSRNTGEDVASEPNNNTLENNSTEPNSTTLEDNALGLADDKARAVYAKEREAAATEPLLPSDDRPPPLPQRSYTDTRAQHQTQSPTQYKLKDIQWQDVRTQRLREVKIVTQNENGPCPLIALINVLLLGNVVQLEGSRKTISEEEMTQMLANTLLQHDAMSPAVAETDVSAILSLLPTLNRGLDVDLQFAHIYDFAESPPLQLFRAFGVDLVHGWVVDVDQEPQVADVLLNECRNSYEGAVEFVLAADEASGGQVMGAKREELVGEKQVARARQLNAWLQETATQLTDCGLHMLGTMLPDHRLCVLFRNNHFSALYKRAPGELFALCTDEAVAGDPRIVWESLRDVHQATSQFFDSQFNLLKLDGRGKACENDYARQARERHEADEDASQIDEDYALALRLHEEEQRRRTRTEASQQLQVRQQDRMPPGMDVREHGHLYGVPQVSREGEARLAKAMYRSASDENFERRMESTFMPNKAAAKSSAAYRQDQNADRDRCIIC